MIRYQREEEDSGEQLDRHWNELLQELRLAQTGTQILFAFLLSIAFQNQFHAADGFTHGVYAATLVASALAVALFLAPVSFPPHRLPPRAPRPARHHHRLARPRGPRVPGRRDLRWSVDRARRRDVQNGRDLIHAAVLAWFVIFWLAIPAYVRATREPEPDD